MTTRELTPKCAPLAYSAPDVPDLSVEEPGIGDLILVGGEYHRVIEVRDYAPGEHVSVIRDDMPARAWITRGGTRWSGLV